MVEGARSQRPGVMEPSFSGAAISASGASEKAPSRSATESQRRFSESVGSKGSDTLSPSAIYPHPKNALHFRFRAAKGPLDLSRLALQPRKVEVGCGAM